MSTVRDFHVVPNSLLMDKTVRMKNLHTVKGFVPNKFYNSVYDLGFVPATVITLGADTAEIPANQNTNGNVLTNDTTTVGTIFISSVNNSSSNVGASVAGSNGGLFTLAANGAWTFNPNSEFDSLTGEQTEITVLYYTVSSDDKSVEEHGQLAVTVTAATAAELELVASEVTKTSSAASGYYDVTLPSGIEPGDLVLIFASVASIGLVPTTTSPSTEWTDSVYSTQNDTYDVSSRVIYKLMPNPVDETVRITGVNSVSNIAVVEVWRNVDNDTPLDTAAVIAGSANSATVINSSITTVTDNTVVIVAGASAAATVQTAAAAPSGYSNLIVDGLDSGTAITAGMAHKAIETADTISPGSWSGFYAPCTSCAWIGATIALRKA